jgi:succinate dehydrogenase / fumarate reductase cytochrome b subunit
VQHNRASRDSRYACDTTVQAPVSSRIMIWTGLTVIAFVVFHIFHFTVRLDPDLAAMKDPGNPERHDVYGMVIAGFQNPLVVIFYILAISFLCSHLSHGIGSIFQTLGLRTEKTRVPFERLGLAISVLLWIGFLSIPLLIVTGVLTDTELATMAAPEAPSEPNP